MTKDELIQFEEEIASLFEAGKIRSPVHLSRGNENDLIEIFQQIKSTDWVFSTHRSHYHALLKGIPSDWLKAEILKNRSITINNAKYKFFSSAILGGILPIAVGVAMTGQNVWAFVGEMAGYSGIFHECRSYAAGHNLPITFVVEDNHFSVDTPTNTVWGAERGKVNVILYRYKRVYPHQGIGKYVIF